MIKNLLYFHKLIGKYTGLELQIFVHKPSFLFTWFSFNIWLLDDTHWFYIGGRLFGDFFSFEVAWTKKTDHAGFQFNLGISGFAIDFHTHDIRHWDDEKNCWETSNEPDNKPFKYSR